MGGILFHMGERMGKWKELKKILLLAFKIAVGSSTAICIAQELQLEYAISAGTITLLTLLATKWGTVKLSAFRLVTFMIAVATVWAVCVHIDSLWLGYGMFIFITVFIAETMGWRTTISVNSVVGAHLLTSHSFTRASIRNELLLVVIGISIAFLLNLFHDNANREKDMIADMRRTEKKLQAAMRGLAACLSNGQLRQDGLDEICGLKEEIHVFLKEAYEFQENTFQSHPGYYIDYFEMRQGQCDILHSLYLEVEKIRSMPKQAGMIADYMLYLADFVVEINEPSRQLERLRALFQSMEKEELPKTRAEFEARAMLYHVLMDLEKFLDFKSQFVKGLDVSQLEKYWN